MGFRLQGLGYSLGMIVTSGLRVQSLRFRVQGRFRVEGLGFRVEGLGFRVEGLGLGFRVCEKGSDRVLLEGFRDGLVRFPWG